MNGEYKNWIEDNIEEFTKRTYTYDKKEAMKEDFIDVFDNYGLKRGNIIDMVIFQYNPYPSMNNEEKEPYEIFRFTPILFLILFTTNWILIGILSRRKRLEIIK
jgi:hypothetical protein